MRYLIFLMFILFGGQVSAQKVGGSWYGKAEIMLEGQSHNYLTELILKQKGQDVEGVMGYYFKNQYQSFYIRGKYNSKNRLLQFKDVPIVFFRTNDSKPSVNCIMDFEATFTASKAKSNLKGYFLRKPQYKYTCPDLNLMFTLDTEEKTDSILKEAVAMQRVWKPMPEEVVFIPELTVEKKLPPPPAVVKFEERKVVLSNEITVKSDSLRITFYDNGSVDGDTISVFYNKVPILQKQGLSVQGINLYLHLDSTTTTHDLSMFAENLGSIPPNTALMIVNDGTTRHEIFLTSSFTLNGTVRIRRQ
jgi:hypothetical protein